MALDIGSSVSELLIDAGFTEAQALALQRIYIDLLERDVDLGRRLNQLMDRLKPEVWLS